MARSSIIFMSLLICLQPLFGAADKPAPTTAATSFTPDYRQFDANRIRNWFSNVGEITSYRITGDAGLEWPSGTGLTAVFQSGLWVAGKVNGEIRTALSEYASEFQPGKILPDGTADDPTLPKYKVYSIYRGDQTSADYLNWPVEDGAPIDAEGKPLLLGDQTHWFVCNDLSAETHANLMNTTPIGLEAQFTIFGAGHFQGLKDIMFVKILLINKSSNVLDSTYVGIWSDPDLGSAADDYVGCDTTYQLSYCYNQQEFDQSYHSRIPSVGFQFIQGPLVPTPDSFGYLGGKARPDYSNLKMTNFYRCLKNASTFYDPENAVEVYNIMSGLAPDGQLIIDPITSKSTPFCVPGDPLTGTGWYEDIYPGDRRFMFASGPFTFAPGDTQEVICAVVVGQSPDQLTGIRTLRSMAPYINQIYHSNFRFEEAPLQFFHQPITYLNPDSADISIEIQASTTTTLDLSNSFLYFSENPNGPFSRKSLTKLSGNLYSSIPIIDSTQKYLCYYFEIKTSANQNYLCPFAAPFDIYKSEIGFDQTPPQILTTSFSLGDTLRTIRYAQLLMLKGSHSIQDASLLDTIWFQYSLNGNGWIDLPLDSVSIESDYDLYTGFYNHYVSWQKNLMLSGLHYADTIRYRCIVTDSSMGHNSSISRNGVVIFTNQETIMSGLAGSDWNSNGWRQTHYFAPGYSHLMLAHTQNNYPDNINTTLTYNIPIVGNQYQSINLTLHGFQNVNWGDSVFIEVSSDKQIWYPEYSQTGIVRIGGQMQYWWLNIPFKQLITKNPFYLRMRFQSDANSEDLLYGWGIDKAIIYTDTTIALAGWFGLDSLKQAETDEVSLSGVFPLHWQILTNDNIDIKISIEYRYDDEYWFPIVTDLVAENSFLWNTWSQPNTTNGQIRIKASDGVNSFSVLFPHTFILANIRSKTLALDHINGHADADIKVAVTDPELLTGDEYEFRFGFKSVKNFSVYNLTKNLSVLDSIPIPATGHESPFFDGLVISITDYSLKYVKEKSGWTSGDCNWNYSLVSQQARYFPAHYEIRFTPGGSVHSLGKSAPFEVWNTSYDYQPPFYLATSTETRYLIGIYEMFNDTKQIVYAISLTAPTTGENIPPANGDVCHFWLTLPLTEHDKYRFKGEYVSIAEPVIIPLAYQLSQNFPNPFNPVTTLRYQLPEKAEVTISVYNLAGQLVTTLVREQKPAGTYSIIWNADNLPSGIYFIELRAGNFHQTRKCLLLK